MDYTSFCRSLKVSESEYSEQLFTTLDQDGSGSIDFKVSLQRCRPSSFRISTVVAVMTRNNTS